MRFIAKLVAATCVVGSVGIAASTGPAAAQQWGDRDWNRTQYGPNYDNYGPRYGSPRYGWSGNYDRGWNTGTQYGSDYEYYGPRNRRRSTDRDGWR
jgi:hypothetical protein